MAVVDLGNVAGDVIEYLLDVQSWNAQSRHVTGGRAAEVVRHETRQVEVLIVVANGLGKDAFCVRLIALCP